MLSDAELRLVRGLPIFSKLPADKLDRLLKGVAPKAYPKNFVLFQQGDTADGFFIVLEGWIKIFRETPQGDEAVLRVFSTGDTFAEAAMFLGGVYPASAQVAEDARLVRIQSQPFREWLESQPEITLGMLAALSIRLHQLITESEQLQTRSATERVADFILKRCPRDEGSAVIALPYDKALLAARLAMKPESLSRVLAKLREIGVRSEQNRVIVSEIADLAAFCAGEMKARSAAFK